MRIIIFILIFVVNHCSLIACTHQNSYSTTEKVLLSNTIVEGIVVDKNSVWLANENRIVTINTVAISKNFSQNQGGTIDIVTNGGIVGDEWHQSSADLELTIGNYGVFFLSEKIDYSTANKIIEGNYAMLGKNSFIELGQKVNSTNAKNTTQNIYQVLPAPLFISEKNNANTTVKANNTNEIEIICIYPNRVEAGNNDTLYIQGNGFGNEAMETGVVYFGNSNDGGNTDLAAPIESFISWTNEEIVMVVPPKAGSGLVKVKNPMNQLAIAPYELTVPFALKGANKDSKPTYLIDKNDLGGYTFTLDENMKNTPAEMAFVRAVNTLRTTIGFNITISEATTTVEAPENDGIDVVRFESSNYPTSGVATAYTQFRRCGNGWEVAGIDIIFKDMSNHYLNWHYGEEDTPGGLDIDFESVALHELLHAFQINHNNEKESLMYYNISAGVTQRNLHTCTDLSATHYINQRSLSYTPTCSGHNAYQTLPTYQVINIDSLECEQATIINCEPAIIEVEAPVSASEVIASPFLQTKVFLQGFYTIEGLMYSSAAINGLLPTNQPFSAEPWNYSGTETMDTDSVDMNVIIDWVLVEFFNETNPTEVVAAKAGILRNDGLIISANGSTVFAIENIDRTANYFFKISQQNHLTVKSAEAINLDTYGLYDCTQDSSLIYRAAITTLADGNLAMSSGDFDGNGLVNNEDYNAWAFNSAAIGVYTSTDADGNGVINNIDYNLWATNRSKVSGSVID